MAYSTRIPKIIVEIEAGASALVQSAGYKIEAGAKARARVKTGYMRGQIRWMPKDATSGEVVGGADYTIYNEFGTAYMSAQPMFVPATEEVRPWFESATVAMLRKAVG